MLLRWAAGGSTYFAPVPYIIHAEIQQCGFFLSHCRSACDEIRSHALEFLHNIIGGSQHVVRRLQPSIIGRHKCPVGGYLPAWPGNRVHGLQIAWLWYWGRGGGVGGWSRDDGLLKRSLEVPLDGQRHAVLVVGGGDGICAFQHLHPGGTGKQLGCAPSRAVARICVVAMWSRG